MIEQHYTFRKNEKLCLKKQIDRLFSDGRWLRSHHLRFVYFETEEMLNSPAQVMFAVPKKIHRTAVARNLMKRRMRESYRLHKNTIYELLEKADKRMIMAIIYNSEDKADFQTLDREIKHLIAQLNSRISRNIN